MPVQLVVEFANEAAYRAALELLPRLGVEIRRQSDLFTTIAVTAPDDRVLAVKQIAGVANVIRDVAVRPACCEFEEPPRLGGDSVVTGLGRYPAASAPPSTDWEGFTILEPRAIDFMRVPPNLTGKGVKVAVLDTGVDSMHPALRDRVVQTVVISPGSPLDGVGHGTHVAGTIAGRAVESPLGPWRGVAQDAEIVNVNVLDNDGTGLLSDVLAGLEASAAAEVDLVNMSLGSPVDILVDPMRSAVAKLTEMGILVVAAAGNFGPPPFTVGTPGSAPEAVTVGAASVPIESYIGGRETAEFSSRGPTLTGSKPDVVAPGGAGGLTQRPEMIYGPATGTLDAIVDGHVDGWAPLRGTSQATPHMTGLLALLLERYRFNRNDLQAALAATSRRRPRGLFAFGPDIEQGLGFVDGVALAGHFERNGMWRPT